MSQVNEFLRDPEFVRWVRFPEKKLDQFWQSWMEANPEGIDDLKLAREILLGIQFPEKKPTPELKQEILNRILTGSKKAEQNILPVSKKHITGSVSFLGRLSQFQKIAAILVFSFMLSFLFHGIQYKSPDVPETIPVRMMTKSAGFGEKLNFRLPDGTMVWLNSGTKLEYPETFDSLSRVVRLYGEAFFEVKKDEARPFRVISENLVTTAIGTSFLIKNIEEEELKVALISGKVSIENKITEEKFLLDPGQQLAYQPNAKSSSISTFSEGDILAWKAGVLVLNKASFEKVIHELERWYGVEFRISGKPSRNWSFSGEFSDQNLDVVLTSMAFIEGFRFELNNKKVHLIF